MKPRVAILCGCALLLSLNLFAADWPQFRGPARDGVAPASVPLVETIGAEGLKPLWTSDEIRGGETAGYSSPVVAAGRVFVYQNLNLPPDRKSVV